MAKKTVYFHIGTHKTGTTALQSFFVANKDILKNKGFIYDFYNEQEMNQGYLAFKPEKWDDIKLDTSLNYIISGEDFYSHILNSSNIINDKLIDFNIHFIVYFKRQDLMIQSVYNQLVKMHGFTKNISTEINYNFNYYQFTQNLKDKFPEAKLTVKVYEKRQFKDGNIFNDFLNILGLDLTNEYKIEKKVVNPSLTTEKMEFTRYINMLDLPIGFRTQISRLIINSALNSNEVSLFRKQDLISPQEAKMLLEKYKEENEKIAKEFLGREDGKLFYDEVEEDQNWKPFPGLKSDVALEILQQINKMDNQILEKLYQFIFYKEEKTDEFINAANFLIPLLIEILDKEINFIPFVIDNTNKTNLFKELQNIVSKENDSADILREVALAFESINDIQTALKVMEQAHILRPKGPVIKQKLEEYKIFLNKEILKEGSEGIRQVGHRNYVGGKWEEIGKLQFDYLISKGLKPNDIFLDIACGSLRAGIHFINYLNKGNYLGIDKEKELIDLGIEKELTEEVFLSKTPEFVVSDKFEFSKFSKIPDYSIAQSLFTHLVEVDIKLCLKNLRKFVGNRPHKFYATFFEVDVPIEGELDYSHSHVSFFYTKTQIEQFAQDTGWKFKYIGGWNHPRDQKIVLFYND